MFRIFFFLIDSQESSQESLKTSHSTAGPSTIEASTDAEITRKTYQIARLKLRLSMKPLRVPVIRLIRTPLLQEREKEKEHPLNQKHPIWMKSF
jgi:hypothetical protein